MKAELLEPPSVDLVDKVVVSLSMDHISFTQPFSPFMFHQCLNLVVLRSLATPFWILRPWLTRLSNQGLDYDRCLFLIHYFFFNVFLLKCFIFPPPSELLIISLPCLGSQDCDTISALKAGKFRFSKPNKYWVESSHKRVSFFFFFVD